MSKSLVLEKAIKFALRMVKLYKHLNEVKKEYVLSKLILISGTHIAKFIKDANQSEDRNGFWRNMNTALQRASETEFWLLMLFEGGYIDEKSYNSLCEDCLELIKMLSKIVKTTKSDV